MANEEAPVWKKKIFIEEEACRVNNTSPVKTRELVQIGSPLKFDCNNPWKIKKEITSHVLEEGNLVISHSETFDYILPYWSLENAKQLVNGDMKSVAMWDVINEIKCNEDADFIFRKLNNQDDDYSLSVKGLFNIHRLGVGDKIGLCWDPRFQMFMFIILSKVRKKKIFSFGDLIETDPVQTIHSNNVKHMTKKITSQDIASGELQISSFEMFDCILPYWDLKPARSLVNGNAVRVGLWDSTEKKYGRTNMYKDVRFTFRKLDSLDYSLSCMTLINDRGLDVDDVIELCWNPIFSKFIFKLISKVCWKKTFSNTPGVMTRELTVTTDRPTIFDPSNITYIGKFITPENITQGTLEISNSQTSEYILPYWKLDKAKRLVNGNVERVGVWDVTEQMYGRTNRYEDVSFTFTKLRSDDYSLSCMSLINDRGLGVGDEIWLCWNPIVSKFIFKVISKVGRKKTFSNTAQELKETTDHAIQFYMSSTCRRYLRKHITPENITQGILEISNSQTSEYILPYWKLDKAKSFVNGNVERVGVWDVTEEMYGRTNRYEDVSFTFTKLDDRKYSLSCMALINDRGLGVGDEIGLCWNPIISKFMFKLISKVCRKKTFCNTAQELKETTDPSIQFFMSSTCRRYLKKHITHQNIAQGTLEISSFEMSEYILPYWKLDEAKSLVNGNVERVGVWDVTDEKYDRDNMYEDASIAFRKLDDLKYSLSCMTLINDRGLGVGDEIWLCWNPIISKFEFKLISRAVLND